MRAIVFTVHNRPYYFGPVLHAWQQVRGIEDWRFIFKVEPTPTKPAMLELIDKFDHPNKLIVENETRAGVLSNPWQGLELAFNLGYEFAVLAEEDLLPATNILEYFHFCDGKLYENESVMAVCTNPPDNIHQPNDIFLDQSFAVWLWGTWQSRWYETIRDTWDHDYSSGNPGGWDWNLNLRVLPANHMKCSYPGVPLVDHLGQYGGVHQIPDEYDFTRPQGFVLDPPDRRWNYIHEQWARTV